MQRRPSFWFLISLLSLAGAVCLWFFVVKRQTPTAPPETPAQKAAVRTVVPTQSAAIRPPLQVPPKAASAAKSAATIKAAAKAKDPLRYRLSNTKKPLKQLLGNDKVILLANAFIDTANPTRPTVPDFLRAAPNSGSYVVQASGPVDSQFRALLAEAGATIVTYIPNNAFLVRASDGAAQTLAGNPMTQAVVPYDPYYKLDASLLSMVMENSQLPPDTGLSVTVFPDMLMPTIKALPPGTLLAGQENSPFGPVLHIYPAQNTLVQLANMPGVELISAAHPRVSANDLTRQTLGVAPTLTGGDNYLGLTGNKVLVEINDSGVDTNHPDFGNRVTGDTTNSLVDTIGHGTHVAGTILGSGSKSGTVVNEQGATNGNFAGMAPEAKGYSVSIFGVPDAGLVQAASINSVLDLQGNGLDSQGLTSDTYLQQQPALTKALISNNSWNYSFTPAYDIAAASYDAAVRDALPGVTGSQPVLFVFSAGDDGGGNPDGTGGSPGSILSPATAKNVITVGAVEQLRNITNTYFTTNLITNIVVDTNGVTNMVMTNSVTTNMPFILDSDSNDQIAGFSARGNVGIGTEGDNGRFKPDVVAPGTFVISAASTQWDTNAYYNPTNTTHFYNITTDTNGLTNLFAVLVPATATNITVIATNNAATTNNPVPLLIYAALNNAPTITNFVGTNQFSLPTNNLPLNPGDVLFFAVLPGGTNPAPVNFDVLVEIATSDANFGYFEALSNMNSGVGPFYRYESGTSMSAASISGILADMQEFFEQRLKVTNSPALMKALLINGARPVSQQYDLSPQNAVTSEGWGLANLPNSIPGTLTNLGTAGGVDASAASLPLLFYDQSPTNALATGQTATKNLVLSGDGQQVPLRVTLVWTDPPGSPAAGVKLVNNLVLVVTNLDTGDVFYGNDIPAGNDFNQATDTNGAPNIDLVNNVQNVYLVPPLGTNYAISIVAQRINVNAVTANTNAIVQDYALVISSGDSGEIPTPFVSVTENPVLTNTLLPVLGTLTNGLPLFNQRVGANPQSNKTNGMANQWNFYVITNTTTFTGMAIAVDAAEELAVPRGGAFSEVSEANLNGTRWDGSGTNVIASINGAAFTGADIDLYVSTNSNFTNLNAAAVANAFKSTLPGGNELVIDTNSTPGEVYYVGVKSEDQQGSQFTVVGAGFDPTAPPTDSNGNIPLILLTQLPVPIPGGSPSNPGKAQVFGFTMKQAQIRKVVVTNTVIAQNFGDYIGTLLGPANRTAVLNNHTFFTNSADAFEQFIYDDSGEKSITGARSTDFPGTLQNFTGQKTGGGLWTFTMVNDSSQFDAGAISNVFSVTVYPQPPTNTFFQEFIPPNAWFYDFVDVPPNATNLTISVGLPAGPGPVQLYVRRGALPDQTNFDQTLQIQSGTTNSLTITVFDSPPLAPGRYFYGVFNQSGVGVTVWIKTQLGIGIPTLPTKWLVSADTPLTIPDDALMDSSIFVGNSQQVADVQVGVRLDHPRESDLVLTLVSPQGTRVLLSENRGGLDTNGYGAGVNITNVFPTTTNGTAQSETNILTVSTNSSGLISGTLVINYNMFTIPDDMRVYYQNVLIFDSGLISFTGTFTVNYGPGTSTNVTVVMNAPGTNPATNDADLWNYTVTSIQQQQTYAIFTDDTNKTTLPIKFATPPFGTNLNGNGTLFSDFETSAPGNYNAPGTVDGWGVLSNKVTVLTSPPPASSGSNFLALRNGSISRNISTVAGETYTLQFANERAFPLDPVHWWPGNSNTMDIMGISPQDGTWLPLGTDSYAPGEVNTAFNFDPAGSNYVKVVANPSLDIGAGGDLTIDCWISPANLKVPHPLLEWNDGSGLGPGLALWISENGGGTLCANLVSSTPARVNHLLSSATGLVQLNTFQHVALTYSRTNNGLAKLYYNGAVVASTNLGTNLVLQTSPSFDLYFGYHVTTPTILSRFVGQMDEIGLYNQALTDAEVQDLFAAGVLGRCGTVNPPTVCPSPMANVLVNGTQAVTVVCAPTATNWVNQPLTFTAIGPSTPLEIDWTNNPSGVQLDSFTLAAPGQNNFYLPEEPLAKVIGQSALGNWQLEIVDNRAGATNPPPMLLSWELNFDFVNSAPSATPLVHGVTQSNFIAPNSIVYYSVTVPPWANFATNILFNVNGGPLNVLFNQNFLPGTNSSDVPLMLGVVSSNFVVLSNGVPPTAPPLLPGQTYFLGVQNTSTNVASFSIQVDFNIITLTNGIPYTNLASSIQSVQYYQYFVTNTNAVAVAFEVLNPNGNVELVARQGAPLPDLAPGDFDYISDLPGARNQPIVVVTNSTPVSLTPGVWYLGVFYNDVNPVNYRIRALESDPPSPTIIVLTNGVGFNFSSDPGVALTNFFEFDIPPSNTNAAALFELYNLSGNADLTMQFGELPYYPYLPTNYFAGSFQPGIRPEQIVIRTNTLVNINGSWFLGVPNNAPNTVNYTIRATLATNDILVPFYTNSTVVITQTGPGVTNGLTLTWNSVNGETYVIQATTNLLLGLPGWTNLSTNVASGTTTTFATPPLPPGVPIEFFRIQQVPTP